MTEAYHIRQKAFRLQITDRHITKGRPRAAGCAVSTDVRCKRTKFLDIEHANFCCFMQWIRLLQGLRK